MEVPELNDEFLDKLTSQSDTRAGNHSIRELEQIRDDGLVSVGTESIDWEQERSSTKKKSFMNTFIKSCSNRRRPIPASDPARGWIRPS